MVRFGASTKKCRIPSALKRYAMNAPIRRVLPTPVAKAKRGEIALEVRDRRKSCLNPLQRLVEVGILLQRDDIAHPGKDLQRLSLRRTQTKPVRNGIYCRVHHSPPFFPASGMGLPETPARSKSRACSRRSSFERGLRGAESSF